MNLKSLTLAAAVMLAVSACKKESPVRPEATTSKKEVNACTGAQITLDGTIVNSTPGGEIRVEAVTTDKSGNILTSGIYKGMVDVNPGSGVFNLTGRGAFIQKTAPDGKFIGAMSIPMSEPEVGNSYPTQFTDIATDNAGNVYLAFKDYAYGSDKAQIIKANSNGTILYRLKLDNTTQVSGDANTGSLWPSRIHAAVDKQGNLVIASIYNKNTLGSLDLDPGPGVFQPTEKQGGYLLKLDPNGKTLGIKQIPGGQYIEDMRVDANNNIHIITTSQFVGGPPVVTSYKYNPSGNLIYKKLEHDAARIAVDNTGGIYWFGNLFNKPNTLIRYSAANTVLWEAAVPYMEAFESDSEGNLYTMGSVNSIWRLTRYNDSAPAWTIPVIPVMTGDGQRNSTLMAVDYKNNVIIIKNGYPDKVRVLKYKPCK